MKTTQNLGLRKPDPEDFYDVGDFNYNADVLDAEVTAVKNQVTNASAKFDATTGHRHTGAEGDAPPIGLDGIDAAAKTTPGGTEPNRIAVTNANGAVGNSERVGGQTLEDLDARYAPASHLASFAHVPYAVATGSANNYSVTINPAPSGYVEGMAVAVKINVDNTGPSTIDVNGMGPKPIKKPNGNDVSAGNLKAGSIYTLRYNGANFILQGEGGGGNAQPEDVLSGKTFTNDYGEQVGTMPNRGAMIITPGTSDIVIPAGYHNGAGYVKGDPNLVAANIKQGVAIFGVTGTVKPKYEASGSVMVSKPSTVYTITGLSFTPILVIITHPWGNYYYGYAIKGSLGGVAIPGFSYWLYDAGWDNGPHNITFLTDGFSFRSPESFYNDVSTTCTWRALG